MFNHLKLKVPNEQLPTSEITSYRKPRRKEGRKCKSLSGKAEGSKTWVHLSGAWAWEIEGRKQRKMELMC